MGKAEKTKRLIIEKAAPIFNVKGVSGSSISDIMNATKLAKGGIYGNFSTKEEISIEAYGHMMDIVKDKLRRAAEGKETSKDKLLAILEFYRSYPLDPPAHGGCPVLNFGVEADDTNPGLNEKVKESILWLQKSIQKTIDKGKEKLEFKKEWDAHVFAVKMFTMIEGAILSSRVLRDPQQMFVVIDVLRQEVEFNSI